MSFEFTLLSSTPNIDFLIGFAGWFGWLTLFAGILIFLWRRRPMQSSWQEGKRAFFVILMVLVPFTSLLFGLRLSTGEALQMSAYANDPQGPVLMLFAALPWMLASGFLGTRTAVILAAFSGILIAYFETHSVFTLLEYAAIAIIFSAVVRQTYRTLTYQLLRHPLVAAMAVSLLYPIIFAVTNILTVGDTILVGAEFVSSRIALTFAANTGQLLFAGLIAEVVATGSKIKWGPQGKLIPAPMETSLELKFLYRFGIYVFPLAVVLVVGIWNVAGKASTELIQEQMKNTAVMAAQNIPLFLDSGQSSISDMAADDRLYSAPPVEIKQILRDNITAQPYFQQLFVMDANGDPLTGYPSDNFQDLNPTAEERLGILLNLQGVIFQTYSAAPEGNETAAQVSFLYSLRDAEGNSQGVLFGRTSLNTNPLTSPILDNLQQMESLQGIGILVDADRIIVYHANSNLVMTTYGGILNQDPTINSEFSSDGSRQLTYNQLVPGGSWSVITSVPNRQIQQKTLGIALPLYGIFLGVGLLVFTLLRVGLREITKPILELTQQSKRMSAGKLDQNLPPQGLTEIGQLATAFEEMRLSLITRIEKMKSMLFVSQRVASTLEMEAAVTPILEAALTSQVTSARLVLGQSAMPDLDDGMPTHFGIGDNAESYRDLDDQILNLNRQQDLVELHNPARASLEIDPEMPQPGAVLASALRYEGKFFGSLWLVYQDGHKFKEEESRFVTTLASQAALAAANARLYYNEQIGRRRLNAVLVSATDPVLVTDHKNRLYLANPAALKLFSSVSQPREGMPINKLIQQKELLDILLTHNSEHKSTEVEFPNNRVFKATASPVTTQGQSMGRVCVLHDITYLKELDNLNTEFVDSVRHDLRNPLKLLRGYANMLETAGNINDKQSRYIDKIVEEVDAMSALVNNLLDLGRIEAGTSIKTEKAQMLELARQVVAEMRTKANQKKLQLTIEDPQNVVPLIEVDKGLLQQAIHNLVENAIIFTNHEGIIKLRISTNQDGVILSVEDNGMGVAPIDQPRIFERFFRVGQIGERDSQSSGLGLAIVKSIIQRHQGKVWMESRLGEGSTFYLLIPYRQNKRELQT